MRVLVTGGAGFIGSNLVDTLVARGDTVVVIDDLSTGRRGNLTGALANGARLVELDIRNAAAVDAAVAAHRPEVIFHLAAQIDVRRSVADPAHDAEVNVGGTIALIEAARRHGVRRIVLSSTGGALYGDADVVPTPESAPVRPLSPYGQSKFAAEGYLLLAGRLHGIEGVVLRYANVYGPRQDPLGEGGVIAIFCGRVGGDGAPRVYGDGHQTRDYVYVGDVVAANLLAAEHPDAPGGAFNIGTGTATSVLELVDALAPFSGSAWAPQFASARPGEVRQSTLDVSHVAAVLGWRPQVDLARGLRWTLASVRAGSGDPDATAGPR